MQPKESPRVLVAEDCPDSRKAVCSFLERAGLAVTPAENGRVAVTLSRTGRFDVVLLDMQMPELDGYEAARLLRADGFRGPVIALTGDVQPGDEQACHDAGCDAYLAKPWDPEQLMQVLEAQLNFSRKRPRNETPATAIPLEPTLQQVASEFARSLPQTTTEMSAEIAAGNTAELARLAHLTAGAAGLFGYSDLCQAARQLERAARDHSQEPAIIEECFRAFIDISRKIVPGPADG
jgi:CheY-like chemotaxis protein